MLRTENIKMAERIGSAIYFVTNFFDDKEPLKWKLRALVTNLLSLNIKDKSETIRETSSLFVVAKNVGIVSDTNYDILIKELSKLEKLDKDEKEALDISSFSQPGEKLHTLSGAMLARPVIKDKLMSVKKNSRQDAILAIIRRKKEVMIKDVSTIVEGCSDKTIQRELLAMVKVGLLKKSGEKRWSRYSLAHA